MNARSEPAPPLQTAGDRNVGDTLVAPAGGKPLVTLDSAVFREVRVAIKVKLGEANLSVDEMLALKAGSVVTLDRRMGELVELHLNDALVARGEIVAVDDHFGVRLIEIGTAA